MSKKFEVDSADIAGAFGGDLAAFKNLPVGVRLLAAASWLAGASIPINKTKVTDVAGVSSGSADNKKSAWRPALDAVLEVGNAGINGLFKTPVSHTVATIEDVKDREQTIAELRQQNAVLEAACRELVEQIQRNVNEIGKYRAAEAADIAPVMDLDERRKNNVKAVKNESEEDA